MNTKNENNDPDYRVISIKFLLGLIFWKALAWILSNWLIVPFDSALSFLVTAFIGYFFFPALKKLGFFRWTTIVLLFSASFIGIFFGNSAFGDFRLWTGLAMVILGVLFFFSNWLYLWILSDGKEINSKDDIMTPRSWLILQRIGSVVMILMGICIALGFLR